MKRKGVQWDIKKQRSKNNSEQGLQWRRDTAHYYICPVTIITNFYPLLQYQS